MLLLSIDGACRRNGKPDCISAGGMFVQVLDEDLLIKHVHAETSYEIQSTNQRGEMLALLSALNCAASCKDDACIVTDSEYLFNTMSKGWLYSWERKGWVTSTGLQVKNMDLWKSILEVHKACVDLGIEIMFYHIKGHCIPFGKVTATTLLNTDSSGAALLEKVYEKYDGLCDTSKKEILDRANKLSEKNNGFKLTPDKLRQFVVSNVMADAIATMCVDAVDRLGNR